MVFSINLSTVYIFNLKIKSEQNVVKMFVKYKSKGKLSFKDQLSFKVKAYFKVVWNQFW